MILIKRDGRLNSFLYTPNPLKKITDHFVASYLFSTSVSVILLKTLQPKH